jgi:hypothetical protein
MYPPTTSCPCSTRSAAATALSTPPDNPTITFAMPQTYLPSLRAQLAKQEFPDKKTASTH